jgi:hypothetical protein
VFVDGSFAIDVVSLSSGSSLTSGVKTVVAEEPGGTVAGGGFAVGSWLARRVSVRVGASFFASATGHAEYSSDDTFEAGVPGVPTNIVRETQITEEETKRQAIDVLIGYHVTHGRWTIGYLAGVTFGREQRHTVDVVRTEFIPPLVPPREQTFDTLLTLFSASPCVGLDLSVQAGSGLAVIPQVRLMGGNGSLSTRFGAAVRWTP